MTTVTSLRAYTVMNYKYMKSMNFEDFSSGRVLYGGSGFTNFPVRLACEIFMRCAAIIGKTKPTEKVSVYDPCCGSGYLVTVLGYLCGEKIHTIYGSDISQEAIHIADQNLKLLTAKGLYERRERIEALYELYHKDSHDQALKSIDALMEFTQETIHCCVFQSDVLLADDTIKPTLPVVDIVITDVPYGNLVSWSAPEQCAANKMLDTLIHCVGDNSVVAVSSDKRQKIDNKHFKRIEKFQAGKRKVEILRKQEGSQK